MPCQVIQGVRALHTPLHVQCQQNLELRFAKSENLEVINPLSVSLRYESAPLRQPEFGLLFTRTTEFRILED